MRIYINNTTLGEMVAAVFDIAEYYSTDPKEVSDIAAKAVVNILRRTPRTLIPPSLPKKYKFYGRCDYYNVDSGINVLGVRQKKIENKLKKWGTKLNKLKKVTGSDT